MKKLRKIHLFLDGNYLSTTTRYATLKEAIASVVGRKTLFVSGRGEIPLVGTLTAQFAEHSNPMSASDLNVEYFKSRVTAEYVKAYISELGGKDNASLMFTVGFDAKELWPWNIFENSRYIKGTIRHDGRVEVFSGNLPPELRKTIWLRSKKCKDFPAAVEYVRQYVEKLKPILLVNRSSQGGTVPTKPNPLTPKETSRVRQMESMNAQGIDNSGISRPVRERLRGAAFAFAHVAEQFGTGETRYTGEKRASDYLPNPRGRFKLYEAVITLDGKQGFVVATDAPGGLISVETAEHITKSSRVKRYKPEELRHRYYQGERHSTHITPNPMTKAHAKQGYVWVKEYLDKTILTGDIWPDEGKVIRSAYAMMVAQGVTLPRSEKAWEDFYEGGHKAYTEFLKGNPLVTVDDGVLEGKLLKKGKGFVQIADVYGQLNIRKTGKRKNPGAFDIMAGQAGGRLIVTFGRKPEEGYVRTMTSHYASMDDFFNMKSWDIPEMDWVQIKGQEKIYITDDMRKELLAKYGGK